MVEYPQLLDHLLYLYEEPAAQPAFERLRSLLDDYRTRLAFKRREWAGKSWLSQADSLLITYADQVREAGKAPLQSLADFCNQFLSGVVSGIHLLPFYPWTSDDGFSVVDYRIVDPRYGDWEDIGRLGQTFDLMFDAVINHISAESQWFQQFLQDSPKHRQFFITIEGNPDLSQVVRPRTLPLLTKFETPSGTKKVWTTFSADQIDLNYRNPEVLLEMIEILLHYVDHGARFIRLDAIAYLWKDTATSSIHLPQTHRVIQLIRAVLDIAAPDVLLITETNVPHMDNISYIGDGTNEAQLVYNFALPPLVLHTFHTGDASALSTWAAGLKLPPGRVTFFNFLASHDGIGLNPVREILSDYEIDALVDRIRAHKGLISYKQDPDGRQSPYELNINYFDALSSPVEAEPIQTQVNRFLAAQAIMLAMLGLPGIYFHSLFGSRGWPAGVARTRRNRTINREKLARTELERELETPGSLRSQVYHRYRLLLQSRASTPAFHPSGAQRVLDFGKGIFTVLRVPPGKEEPVLCLHSVSRKRESAAVDLTQVFNRNSRELIDLISGDRIKPKTRGLELEPYQVLWLCSQE
jgi:sucrose phosphorylase